jgi:beta-lactamase regulating signal transducer with metallopeptidase domain
VIPLTIASPLHLFIIPPESHSQTADNQGTQVYQNAAGSEVYESAAAEEQPHTADPTERDITAPPVQTLPALSLRQIIIIIWLAGAGLCLLYFFVLYAALRKKLRRNYAYPSKRLRGLFEEVKAEMGIKASINLVCQYEYGTPSLMFPNTTRSSARSSSSR